MFTTDAGEYQIDQFYVTRVGQTCIATFSFSPTVSQADREALAESVLASWSWTGRALKG